MITITATHNGQPWTWHTWYTLNPTGITEVIPNAVYTIHDDVTFGDGLTATAFSSTGEMVWFDDGRTFNLTENATFQSGQQYGQWGLNGSFWSLGPADSWRLMLYLDTPIFNFFASRLHIRTNVRCQFYGGRVSLLNATLSSIYYDGGPNNMAGFYFYGPCQSLHLSQVRVENALVLSFNRTPDTCRQLHCHRCYYGIATNGANVTVSDAELTSCEYDLSQGGSISSLTLLNPLVPPHSVKLNNTDPDAYISEQYSVLLETIDENEQPLGEVSLSVRQSHVVSYNNACYICRQSHTSTDFTSDLAAEYWALAPEIPTAPPWQAATDYQADHCDIALFGGSDSLTTNPQGQALLNDQPPFVPARRWTTTDEYEERWAYTFTFKKSQFQTVTLSAVLLEGPVHWRIKMTRLRPRLITLQPTVESAVSGAFA